MWSIIHSMQTIQVVLDEGLLRATDRLAGKSSMNRSALIREALKEYLKKAHLRDLEHRDREGFEKRPDTVEFVAWEEAASWPAK